jgi:hypothetical protein
MPVDPTEIHGMHHALSRIHRARPDATGSARARCASRFAIACALALALLATRASADVIDISLNVFYTNPSSPASGGTWEVVAKSDGAGIAGLQMYLTDIATWSPTGPRGLVNGSDPAGFSIFFADPEPGFGFTEIIAGQALLDASDMSPSDEQTAFYGVGTLTNGAPNYPGKPAGTNSIGPVFASLTNVQGVPWAIGDAFSNPAWNTAARIANGTFTPGDTPGFHLAPSFISSGNVFRMVGTNKVYGQLSENINATTIVRTNLSGVILPDYNLNGVVDTADFVIWRKTNGQMGSNLAADGNNDGRVDQLDYDLWRMQYGAIAGAGASTGGSGDLSTGAVPEPSASVLLALGAVLAAARMRFATRPPRRTGKAD